MITSLSIILILNYFLFKFNKKFAQSLNLFDNPDKIRKFHKNKVPLTGGIIILSNALLALVWIIIDQHYFKNFSTFETNFDLVVFLLSVLVFFFSWFY